MTFVFILTVVIILVNIVVLFVDVVFVGFLINVKLFFCGSVWVCYLLFFYFLWGGIFVFEMRGGSYLFNVDFDG